MRWRTASMASLVIVGACTGQDSLEHRAPAAAFDSVAMQRSACLGRCPVYEVKISSDGKVTFQGEKYVAYVGTHSGSARASDLARLDQTLSAVDFFSLRRQYESGEDGCTTWMTDNPTVRIRVAAGGKEHEVTTTTDAKLKSARQLTCFPRRSMTSQARIDGLVAVPTNRALERPVTVLGDCSARPGQRGR